MGKRKLKSATAYKKGRKKRRYQMAGSTGSNYALPTNMATTSTMSAVASPNTLQNLESAERERELTAAERVRAQDVKKMQLEQASEAQFQNAVKTQGSMLSKALPNAALGAQVGRGTATAAQVAKGSKDTAQLLTNLGAYGQGTKAGIGAAFKGMGPGVAGAGLSLAGAGVKKLSDDADATTMNFGESAGTLMQGAGTGLGVAGVLGGLGATGFGLPLAAIGALGYGVSALIKRNKARKEATALEEDQTNLDLQENINYSNVLNQSREMQGADSGFNIGTSMSNSYLPGNQQFTAGGVKLPGGQMINLPGGAKEFIGNKHSQGGIMLDKNTEVEGGETMDKVVMRKGGAEDYIFSEYLKIGGKSFADRHKNILKNGGGNKEIQNLAKLQEQVAKREGRDENGPRGPERIAQAGGVRKHQSGDAVTNVIPTTEALEEFELDAESAYARDFPEGQSKTEEGLYRRAEGDAVTMKEVEALKASNPWYDWEDFDPTNAEDVKKFQEAYNEQAPEGSKIRVDGKVGEQTVSAYIPYKQQPEETPTTQDTDEDTDEDVVDLIPPPKKFNKITKLPSIIPLAGALAQLPRSERLKDPKAVKPSLVGKQRLGRVNMNAERAAGEAGRIALSKAAENLGGPASFASKIAGNQQARSNSLNIANQEARQNLQLSTSEAGMNLQTGMQNANNQLRASMFNRQRQDAVDKENYLQKNIDKYQRGQIAADTLNTYQRQYADERLARASDPFGAYERQRNVEAMRLRGIIPGNRFAGMTEGDRRDAAAQMYTNQMSPGELYAGEQAAYVNALQKPAQEEVQSKNRGGYIARSKRIRRKRKK